MDGIVITRHLGKHLNIAVRHHLVQMAPHADFDIFDAD
jgi:hypothetical protein